MFTTESLLAQVFMEAVQNMPTLSTLNMKQLYMARLDSILENNQR